MFLRILAVLTLLAAIPHPAVAQVPVPRSPIGGPERWRMARSSWGIRTSDNTCAISHEDSDSVSRN
jgi:hypothetical protein